MRMQPYFLVEEQSLYDELFHIKQHVIQSVQEKSADAGLNKRYTQKDGI